MPELSVTVAPCPVIIAPTHVTSLAGINTPLGGIVLDQSVDGTVTLIIATQVGKLFADSSPGYATGGSGSNAIWISGSTAQVNAVLATLVVRADAIGPATLSIRAFDALGQPADPVDVMIDVLPLISVSDTPEAMLGLDRGTLTLDSRHLDGLTLDLVEPKGATLSTTVVLVNSTLGAKAHLNVVNTNVAGGVAPRVALAGAVELDGSIDLLGGEALITLASGSVLTNAGSIQFLHSAATVTGAGTLRNDGVVAVTSGGVEPTVPVIDVAIAGSGRILIDGSATLEIGRSVSARQLIQFGDGPATLVLDQASDVHATLSGFGRDDQILLRNARIDAVDFTRLDGIGGVLTLYDGATVVASLHFIGDYRRNSFDVGITNDLGADPRAGVRIAFAACGSGEQQLPPGLEVYRFFDRANGAQLLTADAGERDEIAAHRTDLVYEGAAMRAIDPVALDPAAVPINRFFDTANGTHFLTASAIEATELVATRPDLVFEPGSTLLEHVTPNTGDVPVFRFFDSTNGTHLFTASAGERASILLDRPDLIGEGIAFYAPAQ